MGNDRASELREKSYSIILAGGTGTRLWPMSRERSPKQLMDFSMDGTFIQNTLKRLFPLLDKNHIRIVCGSEHQVEIGRQMADIGIDPEEKIISEPCGKNTAPAILLGTLNVAQRNPDAVLFVFPADHVIIDIDDFHDKIASAFELAEQGRIVTFGIQPTFPETGYGYIEGGEFLSNGAMVISRFVEKPDAKTARAYVDAGNFFWNSGMFAFKASTIIHEFETLAPEIIRGLEKVMRETGVPDRETYEKLPNISIDYAIMEKTELGAVLPSGFGWSDIGSWKSLFDVLPKDADDNAVIGDVFLQNTKNCLVLGKNRLIALNRIRDVVIIDTQDAVFVSDMENSRDVKDIASDLRKAGRLEAIRHMEEKTGWGTSILLDESGEYEIRKLKILPERTCMIKNEHNGMMRIDVLNNWEFLNIADQDGNALRNESFFIPEEGSVTLKNTGNAPCEALLIEWSAPDNPA